MENLLSILSESPLIYLIKKEPYTSRFEDELNILHKLNQLENILLASTIKDIIKNMNIPFFIRGSAGGSLILYLLGFSDIDPVKYDITFERFINEYRTSLGDIDFDLPRILRDRILKNIKNNFNNKIAILCTKVYYKEKSSLREAIRQICRYRKLIPKEVFYDKEKLKNFIKHKCDGNPDMVFKRATELMGTFNYYSTHVGGIIITNKNDKFICKKEKPTKQKLPLVCIDKNDVDKEKRFKIDLLANTGLDIINIVYGNVKLTEEYFPPDEKVFDLIRNGNTIGIVYGESPLIRSTFIEYHKRYGLNSLEDIAKCLSMIRPMCRQNGKDSDLIFDDDWITALSSIFNINYSKADFLRRRLAKDDPEVKSLIIKKVSLNRLKQLMQIKSYGFCKAHAMNYANLIYCQTYAKYHKPIEFSCAMLNTLNGRIYHNWVYFYDALKNGIKIYVNKENDKYKIKNNCIIPRGGIQLKLKPLSIEEEIKTFNAITSLEGIKELNLVACSRRYKDIIFSCELIKGELENIIKEI